MRAALRSRLERLEVRVEPNKPQLFRSGDLKAMWMPAAMLSRRP